MTQISREGAGRGGSLDRPRRMIRNKLFKEPGNKERASLKCQGEYDGALCPKRNGDDQEEGHQGLLWTYRCPRLRARRSALRLGGGSEKKRPLDYVDVQGHMRRRSGEGLGSKTTGKFLFVRGGKGHLRF